MNGEKEINCCPGRFAGGLVFICHQSPSAAAGDRVLLVTLDGNLVEELALAVDLMRPLLCRSPGERL